MIIPTWDANVFILYYTEILVGFIWPFYILVSTEAKHYIGLNKGFGMDMNIYGSTMISSASLTFSLIFSIATCLIQISGLCYANWKLPCKCFHASEFNCASIISFSVQHPKIYISCTVHCHSQDTKGTSQTFMK